MPNCLPRKTFNHKFRPRACNHRDVGLDHQRHLMGCHDCGLIWTFEDDARVRKLEPIPVKIVNTQEIGGALLGGLLGKPRNYEKELQACLDSGNWFETINESDLDKPIPPESKSDYEPRPQSYYDDAFRRAEPSSLRTAEIANTINTGDLKTQDGVR